jgi:hypothetical protein
MSRSWLLQSAGYSEWLDGDFFQALISPFTDLVGVPVVAMYFFGVIGLGYYTTQQSVIIPVVMLILIGGITIGLAPVGATKLAVATLAVALTGIGYLVFQRARTGT